MSHVRHIVREHEGQVKRLGITEPKTRFWGIGQWHFLHKPVADPELVQKAPLASIFVRPTGQSAALQITLQRLHQVRETLAETHILAQEARVGIVVHVAHHDDVRLRAMPVQTVAQLTDDAMSRLTVRITALHATQTTGQVTDDDVQCISAHDASPRVKQVARRSRPIGHRHTHSHPSEQAKIHRLIKQRHIDTARVGALRHDEIIFPFAQGCASREPHQDAVVFDLGEANKHRRTPLSRRYEHARQVRHLLIYTGVCPMAFTIGREFVVEFFGVVRWLKQVLAVVKHDAVVLHDRLAAQHRHTENEKEVCRSTPLPYFACFEHKLMPQRGLQQQQPPQQEPRQRPLQQP